MKAKKRQKLCYGCEGDVDLDVIVCPYCAADLREEKPEMQRASFSPSISSVKPMNGEDVLYPPPYSKPMAPEVEPTIHGLDHEAIAEEEVPSDFRAAATGIALFALGANFIFLSLILAIFSKNGVLILQWDASWWAYYFLASIPLLFYGYRFLKEL